MIPREDIVAWGVEHPLPARGLEMIEYFDSFNPDHEPDDLVCLTANKTKIGRRNINRTLDSMCRDANLPHMGIHSLRHSYGSILLERGVNINRNTNRNLWRDFLNFPYFTGFPAH